MKKHILAAAVATAVAVPALAQNVTMSGLVDVGHGQSKIDVGANSTKFANTGAASGWSTSTIVFTATEDLGGGLKATAVVSSFYDSGSTSPSNAAADAAQTAYNTIGGRDRFIRLEGGFGGLQIGRFTPAINGLCTYACAGGTNNTAGTIDSGGADLVNGTLGGRKAAIIAGANGATTAKAFGAAGAAVDNAANMEHQSGVYEYTTPTQSGFNAQLTYIHGKVDNSVDVGMDKATQYGIRFNYTAGPLAMSLANAERKTEIEGAAAANNDKTKSTINWFGASYDLGVAKLFYSHGQRKDKLTDGVAAEASLSQIKANTFGVQVPMGATTLTASMYEGEDDNTDAANDERDLSGYQLTARYTLSKRTAAYIAYGTNKDKGPAGAVNDFKRVQTSAGIVHSF